MSNIFLILWRTEAATRSENRNFSGILRACYSLKTKPRPYRANFAMRMVPSFFSFIFFVRVLRSSDENTHFHVFPFASNQIDSSMLCIVGWFLLFFVDKGCLLIYDFQNTKSKQCYMKMHMF